MEAPDGPLTQEEYETLVKADSSQIMIASYSGPEYNDLKKAIADCTKSEDFWFFGACRKCKKSK